MWLRHLIAAETRGLSTNWRAVAELGPGDSIGVGLAALLTGADNYVALDLVPFARSERNAEILEALITLFRERAEIPGADEFPGLEPRLDDLRFPNAILDDARLESSLSRERLDAIRRALVGESETVVQIRYHAPWTDAAAVEPGSIDLIFSQAVLEHVDDPAATYRAMTRWLAPAGTCSHVIDYSSHGLARPWNGHWGYGDTLWRLIRGRRSFSLNRLAHSDHLALARAVGLEVVHDERALDPPALDPDAVAKRFRHLDTEDLATRTGLFQLRRSDSGTPRS